MSHEYCKQHSRPMPRPVMAAIRVRRSRRWVTCRKAYCGHSPRQAQIIAVDNSEDEIGQQISEEIPNRRIAGEGKVRANADNKGYASSRGLIRVTWHEDNLRP